jgi:hypothetical protein
MLKYFYDEVYKANIYFFSGKEKDFKDWLKKRFNYDYELQYREGFFFSLSNANSAVYIIYLADKRNMNYLRHEVLHLVFRLFHERNIECNIHTDEAFAYYTDYVIEQYHKLMRIKYSTI